MINVILQQTIRPLPVPDETTKEIDVLLRKFLNNPSLGEKNLKAFLCKYKRNKNFPEVKKALRLKIRDAAKNNELSAKSKSILKTALIIVEKHSLAILKEILLEKGESFYDCDLPLLRAVLKHPGLEHMLFNRKLMIQLLQKEVYDKFEGLQLNPPPEARALEEKLAKTKSETEKAALRERISAVKKQYTERPPLDKLPSLQLLRLYLLKKALENEKFLTTIKRIVFEDIKDKTREHGAKLYIDDNGNLEIKEIMSKKGNDCEYSPDWKDWLDNAVILAHLHALKIDNETGSPSGYIGALRNDFLFTGASGLVISACGITDDFANIKINPDFYFTTMNKKNDPAYVIDAGIRKISLNKKETEEIRDNKSTFLNNLHYINSGEAIDDFIKNLCRTSGDSPQFMAFGEELSTDTGTSKTTAEYFAEEIIPVLAKNGYTDLVLEDIFSKGTDPKDTAFYEELQKEIARLDNDDANFETKYPYLYFMLSKLWDPNGVLKIIRAAKKHKITLHGAGLTRSQAMLTAFNLFRADNLSDSKIVSYNVLKTNCGHFSSEISALLNQNRKTASYSRSFLFSADYEFNFLHNLKGKFDEKKLFSVRLHVPEIFRKNGNSAYYDYLLKFAPQNGCNSSANNNELTVVFSDTKESGKAFVLDKEVLSLGFAFIKGLETTFNINTDMPNYLGNKPTLWIYPTKLKRTMESAGLEAYGLCNLSDTDLKKFVDEFASENKDFEISIKENLILNEKDGITEKYYRFVIKKK